MHVITTKGKGFESGRKRSGNLSLLRASLMQKREKSFQKSSKADYPPKYQDVFGETIVELARGQYKNIIGITPAMLSGSSLKMMLRRIS